MGKNLILKDLSGVPAGYLFQGIRSLRCRVSQDGMGVELILFYADGKHQTREIAAADGEVEWEEAGGMLDGAVMVKGGVILAASDAPARERFKRLQLDVWTKAKEEHAPMKRTEKAYSFKEPAEEEEKKQEKQEQEGDAHFPERRWPPPPCWQSAVYDQGIWTQ